MQLVPLVQQGQLDQVAPLAHKDSKAQQGPWETKDFREIVVPVGLMVLLEILDQRGHQDNLVLQDQQEIQGHKAIQG